MTIVNLGTRCIRIHGIVARTVIVVMEVPDPARRVVFSKVSVMRYFIRVVSISSMGLLFGLFLRVSAEEWPGALFDQDK